MRPAGIKAFEARDQTNPKGYSSSDRPQEFDPGLLKEFKRAEEPWRFFRAQAPYYRQMTIFWVMSAQREESRRKRLSILIAESGRGRRLNMLSPGSTKKNQRETGSKTMPRRLAKA